MANSSQSVDQILVGNVPVVAAVKCHEGLQVGCSFLYLINVIVQICLDAQNLMYCLYRVFHNIGSTLFFVIFSDSGAHTEILLTIFQQPWKFAIL